VYYRKGDAKRALEYLQTAQKKLPENPEVNYHLGMALVQDGKKQDAKGYLQKSLAGKEEFTGKEDSSTTPLPTRSRFGYLAWPRRLPPALSSSKPSAFSTWRNSRNG
jgi:tetratricopeptide (TPR) repeat protein